MIGFSISGVAAAEGGGCWSSRAGWLRKRAGTFWCKALQLGANVFLCRRRACKIWCRFRRHEALMATSGMDCGANLEHRRGSGRKVVGESLYLAFPLVHFYLVVIGIARAKKSCESRLRTAFDHRCLGRDVSQILTKFQSNPIGCQSCYPICAQIGFHSRAGSTRKNRGKCLVRLFV